jgi:Zn-finger nucleic acid-binding protein
MNCIVCNEPMVVLELDEVEIDHCLACGGTWLDSGELEAILENPREVREMLGEMAKGAAHKRSDRKCPICLKKMEYVTVGKAVQVRLDKCPQGDGFWFDRGELEQILHLFDTDRHSKVHGLLKEMFKNK